MSDKDNKRVLFISSAEYWYTRNVYILDNLKSKYEVKAIISNSSIYIFRIIANLSKFIFGPKNYNFIFIGFLAQPLIPIVRLFYKKTIIADFFISLYDTICFDRKIINPRSILGKLILKYEKWSLNLSDEIIVDTENSKKYFIKTFQIPSKKIKVLYVLPDRKIFYPQNKKQNNIFEVFFYGRANPLQGIPIILQAAKILINENVHFTLVGPIEKKYSQLIKELNLNNVKFIDWVKMNELPSYIAEADVCLGGHFGNNEKAKRVIAGKTFQFMAMKKAVLVGDNNANKELFTHQKNCLMVQMDNPSAIADAIVKLKKDPLLRDRISEQAYATMINLSKNNIL